MGSTTLREAVTADGHWQAYRVRGPFRASLKQLLDNSICRRVAAGIC